MNALNRKPPVANMLAVVIVALGLLLCSWEAYAETLYRVSPKIAPRAREASPVLSPFLNQSVQPGSSTAKVQPSTRIEAEPSHEIPVSYTQPQATEGENADSMPTSWPEKSTKPAAHTEKSNSNHPVVHPPEPLLPGTPESSLPNVSELLSRADDAAKSIVLAPTVQGQVEIAEAFDQRAVADDRLIAQATTGNSSSSVHNHEKPTVHFPEELTPEPSAAVHSSVQPSSRNIYPISYQPYIGRVTEMRQRDLETAISHYNRAAYYEQRNKLDEAIGEYKQAILLHSNFADAYVGMSTAYIRKNDWENVTESLQKALSMKQRFMDPSNIVQAWYNLSTAHCVADGYSPARRYYKKVQLAGHPNSQELWEFIQKNCTP